jgi:endoglucanase
MKISILSTAAAFAGFLIAASGAPHDYSKALHLSLLFYKAQRSGKLPDAEVPWRRSAFVNDKTADGRDMTGGFFDAGDYVHFMLPQATTITTLANGMVDFRSGYNMAGQTKRGLEVLGWGADFLAKCVISPTRVVAQVGLGGPDHSTWTRPEDVTSVYPVSELSPSKPGADLAGSMAAALAASSMAFKPTDGARASRYLRAAQTVFDFGAKYPGFHSKSIPDAAAFYSSSSQFDDMALGAVWLFRATGNATYLQQARTYFARNIQVEGVGWPSHDWDGQQYMAAVQLAALDPKGPQASSYRNLVDKIKAAWLAGGNGSVKKTPKGLMWLAPWGSLRHNGNVQFVLLLDGKLSKNAATLQRAVCHARTQTGYILGDSGRSYLVGYGSNFPKQPHHRAASCPSPPTACGWDWFHRDAANPQTLLGALVGGPDANDAFEDKRSDYIRNEVAIDYSSGFTGALAALVETRSVKC